MLSSDTCSTTSKRFWPFSTAASHLLSIKPGSDIFANTPVWFPYHPTLTNFGDANAQYNLGRIYLDGSSGIDKDTRQAARWLSLAAEKGNPPAQALLGQMLFNGQDGVLRQRARGLMWLTLARDAATDPKDQWIVELYEKAISAASDPDRQMALAYLEAQLQKRD